MQFTSRVASVGGKVPWSAGRVRCRDGLVVRRAVVQSRGTCFTKHVGLDQLVTCFCIILYIFVLSVCELQAASLWEKQSCNPPTHAVVSSNSLGRVVDVESQMCKPPKHFIQMCSSKTSRSGARHPPSSTQDQLLGRTSPNPQVGQVGHADPHIPPRLHSSTPQPQKGSSQPAPAAVGCSARHSTPRCPCVTSSPGAAQTAPPKVRRALRRRCSRPLDPPMPRPSAAPRAGPGFWGSERGAERASLRGQERKSGRSVRQVYQFDPASAIGASSVYTEHPIAL